MGNGQLPQEELTQTIELIKKRIEFEDYFSADGVPFQIQDQSKAMAVAALQREVENCKLCPLYQSRKRSVFGEGNLDADIMFVGEAPGHDEDLAGLPFVGAAGQLLTKIIQAMNFKREDVYITNVLRCRPPGNRNPAPEEVACCKPYLLRLLKIIKPKVICTLGKFAAHSLLDEIRPISRLRGNFFEIDGVKLMPTFHPAYLLRNPEDKKLVWHDMKKIIKLLKDHET